ncbi:MAG: M23 family metallopeptidase, partial [Bacteroidales bacterium]|nr:M23 family metallopeptidase [Bacteroidales bacterium]
LEGYHNIVIVRHGEYLTVYGGLDRLNVKKGDKLKAGQQLGTIYVDRDDDNRASLHFEIRLEKQKLNPVEWVK